MGLAAVCYIICLLLISVYIVTDGFDLGTGILSLFMREQYEKDGMLYALWPVWNTNEVWLLAAFVFLFSAFTSAYTAILSSLYIAVIILLMAFILRGVAIEFREKADWKWKVIFDALFGVGSLVATFCLGMVSGNLIEGLPLDRAGLFKGGPFDWLNPPALFFGLLFTVFCVQHGTLFLITRIDEPLNSRLKKAYPFIAILYILLLIAWIYVIRGFSFMASHTGPLKTLTLIFASTGGLAVLLALIFAFMDHHEISFGLSAGSVFLIAAGIISTVYPVIVPSTLDPMNALTALNSSNPTGLRISLIIVFLGLPVVLFCNYLLYRVFGRKE